MASEGPQIEIVRLVDQPSHLSEVVQWIFDQWGRANDDTRESIREMLLQRSDCPPALIAVASDESIGVVAFNRHRLSTKESESTPADSLDLWINVLYVREDWRGKGAGSKLLAKAIDKVREVGTERFLYVYTDVAEYYQQQGWMVERSGLEGGYTVLSFELIPIPE